MLGITETAIPDVKILDACAVDDAYGCFIEPFNKKWFGEYGLPNEFVQDSHILS